MGMGIMRVGVMELGVIRHHMATQEHIIGRKVCYIANLFLVVIGLLVRKALIVTD